MKTIDVIISPTGNVKMQTNGFTGPSCREASQFLEEALGVKGEERLTAEFHQNQTRTEGARQQAGTDHREI
jgi:hypothetical protein